MAMNRSFLQDIRPKRRKSEGGDESNLRSTPLRQSSGGRSVKMLGYGGSAVLLILIAGFGYTTFAGKATVRVTPVQETVTVDHIFGAIGNNAEGAGIPFERMQIEDTQSVSIKASGVREVEEKARGNVTVINEQEEPQRLIARTRFESKSGYVYRIDKPIVVPSATMENGVLKAGTLQVEVVADMPGSDYNMAPGDFTLPGLKGSDLFTKVYAKSAARIEGGFVGEANVASVADIERTKTSLERDLTVRLLEKAKLQVPQGYILYEDAVFMTFTSVPQSESAARVGESYTETLRGELNAFIFSRELLATNIAQRMVSDLGGSKVDAVGLEKLDMRLLGKLSIDPVVDERFSFSIQGQTTIVWQYSQANLGAALAGLSKRNYQDVFRDFPTIERAETTFSPKWRRSFPKDVEKITIETVVE